MNIDFLYVLHFPSDQRLDKAVQRLICSINSIKIQGINIIVGNYSEKCIYNTIKFLGNINYFHKPIVYTPIDLYNKSLMINYAVKNYVKSEYFIFSDIDLVYPSNYIKTMLKQTELKRKPVRVIPYNYNIYREFYSHIYEDFRKQPRSNGGFAHGNGIIHLKSFMDIRGFDEAYIGYNPEDADFNERISIINTLVYLKEIASYHLYHQIGNRDKHDIGSERCRLRREEYKKIKRLEVSHAIINSEKWGEI